MLDGGNGVLPGPTRGPFNHVCRSGLQIQDSLRATRALIRRIAAEAHPRNSRQRNANDRIEIRDIAMPPQLRPRAVLGNRAMLECRARYAGPASDLIAQRQEKIRQRFGGIQPSVAKVVASAETDNAALCPPLPVAGLLQREL